MINKLTISNFKSIKNLKLDCKRINIFIGEPNVGKSNILEALGLLSWGGVLEYQNIIRRFIRIKYIPDLFYDNILDLPIQVAFNGNKQKSVSSVSFQDELFQFTFHNSSTASPIDYAYLEYNGSINRRRDKSIKELSPIKFYRFLKQDSFDTKFSSYLLPPIGSNLFALVMGHKNLKQRMNEFFGNFGYNLVMKPQQRVFEFQKMVDDIITSFPYELCSDTLQRIIFYTIAIESNKDSTLIFEEPESHAFPYYTKYLGERIALDESNQYFIATHNTYLIKSILEKAKSKQINVFATYLKDYQTKVNLISGNKLPTLLESDPFFNISRFVGEDGE